MGNERQHGLDGPTISELTNPNARRGIAQPEGPTITHFNNYSELLPGETPLAYDETLIHEFWIGPGKWYVSAKGKLKGTGDLVAQVRMILTATPSNAFPVTNHTSVNPGGWESIACQIKPESQDGMHVTVSAAASVGTCVLREVEIFADPD